MSQDKAWDEGSRFRGPLAAAFALITLTASLHVHGQEDIAISDAARQQFKVGVNLLEDPDGARYEEAYEAFKRAYATSPSPKILNNLGLAAMMLERDGEAIAAYEQYLAKVGSIEPALRKQIETDLETLRAGLVRVQISIQPDGAILTDTRSPVRGAPVVNRYGPLAGSTELGLRSGYHSLTIKRDGYISQTIDFDARPGERIKREITLEPVRTEPTPGPLVKANPVPTTERPVPTSVYVTAIAASTFAIAAGVTGFLALSKQDDYQARNSGSDPESAKQLREDGQQLNLVTDALLGGAVLAGCVSAVLYFARPTEQTRAGSAAVLRVQNGKLGLRVPF